MPASAYFSSQSAAVAATSAAFQRAGGLLRTREATHAGIHSRTLASMTRSGQVIRLTRGIYQLPAVELVEPDLAVVARLMPAAIVCLVSALSHHGLTTQIPRRVDLAVPRGYKDRRVDHPPIRLYRFGKDSLAAGTQRLRVGGRPLRVYSAAKTIADCFKFRNKIGRDIAIEALREYLARKEARPQDLLRFARINRVEHVMAPYLEALL